MSIGLRYWSSIRPTFAAKEAWYQPSWKFSIMPQKAQKHVMRVDNVTASHPIFWRLSQCLLIYQQHSLLRVDVSYHEGVILSANQNKGVFGGTANRTGDEGVVEAPRTKPFRKMLHSSAELPQSMADRTDVIQ
jgi:hypothetical protein